MKSLVFFWFQTDEKASHDKNLNRLHLALHAIRRDNTHDLFVRVITPIESDRLEDAEKRLEEFVFQFEQALKVFLIEKQYIGKL